MRRTKNLFKTLFLLSFPLILTYPAYAGGVSGGGLTTDPETNPWFLDNTLEVSYCIETDENIFPESAKIEQDIKFVLKAWKNKLRSNATTYGRFNMRLAGQKFFREECSEETDLRFQFGILHEDQKTYFQNLDRVIGWAQKTSYDPYNMRAKGFIYLSPSVATKAINLKEKDLFRQIVLAHELGHVFGLSHYEGSIMDEFLVDRIVSGFAEKFHSWQKQAQTFEDYFSPFRFTWQNRVYVSTWNSDNEKFNKFWPSLKGNRLGIEVKFNDRFSSPDFSGMRGSIDGVEINLVAIDDKGQISELKGGRYWIGDTELKYENVGQYHSVSALCRYAGTDIVVFPEQQQVFKTMSHFKSMAIFNDCSFEKSWQTDKGMVLITLQKNARSSDEITLRLQNGDQLTSYEFEPYHLDMFAEVTCGEVCKGLE